VKGLLDYFFDLCLLRAKPQQLPGSPVLFWLMLLAYLCAGMLLIYQERETAIEALLESMVDALLLLGLLYVLLQVRRLTARFLQSATALLGVSALLSLVAVPLLTQGASGDSESAVAMLAATLLLVLIVWNLVVFGHILRHALGVTLGLGIVLAFAVDGVSYTVLSQLFPAP